jgi:hypothetical protein
VSGVVAGHPVLEVSLRASREGEVAGSEPVQQHGGGPDVLADGDKLAVGCRRTVGAVAEPPQQMPDGVAAQQLLLVGVGAAVDGRGDLPLQPGHLLITRR